MLYALSDYARMVDGAAMNMTLKDSTTKQRSSIEFLNAVLVFLPRLHQYCTIAFTTVCICIGLGKLREGDRYLSVDFDFDQGL